MRWLPCIASLSLLAAAARAQSTAPPSPLSPAAAPFWVEVLQDDAPVYTQPDANAARRGSLRGGARLLALGSAAGSGCGPQGFVQLAPPHAFACAAALQRAEAPASSPRAEPQAALSQAALPYEYLSARREGVRVYTHPQDAPTDQYDRALGRGFSVIATQRMRYDGVEFVRTRTGDYVRARDLRPVHASRFQGVELGPLGLDGLAFVVRSGARVHAADDSFSARLPRYARVRVRDEVAGDRRVVLDDGRQIAAAALVRPRLRPRPGAIAPDARWLDVDLERQTLVAYQGDRPRYATLISSGRKRPGTRTPRGVFRIWVKLLSSDMRDRERPELERRYALEAVPWVQYFHQGFGLHAAFWHDRFGARASRGCINLSPRDARWLFAFTAPALPRGFHAILPLQQEAASWVVVR